MDPNHVLPRTYEWSAAVEWSIKSANAMTGTYVGAAGRKLMRQNFYANLNPIFPGQFALISNSANSSYQSLQAQYRHRLKSDLQMLLSYTWSHSIDDVSSDAYFLNLPPGASPSSSERGSSDYDIRQTVSGAISYNMPAPSGHLWKDVLSNWSADSIFYARTAPPVNVVTGQDPFHTLLLSGASGVARPDLILGRPVWIADSNVAGGKRIDAGAFRIPGPSLQGTLGRNTLRGFGATQIDLALRRQFALSRQSLLQIRVDTFNIFNHPNFGGPINYLSSPLFGRATQSLGASMGGGGQTGGLNPLFQIGGPRSMQLALRLQF